MRSKPTCASSGARPTGSDYAAPVSQQLPDPKPSRSGPARPPRGVPWRPTREQIARAAGKTVPDVIADDLAVLFCGINPGLYSGATRHHFARPGNRFWPVLHKAGFSDRLLTPFDEDELLARRIGVTNLVKRATATAAELDKDELQRGARILARKVRLRRPTFVAFLGIDAYRSAFQRPKVRLGEQEQALEGARVWVLPNASGLNAHYQVPDLVRVFAELARAAGVA
jgi:TDG/mug DNA glycosylase family protein